MNKDLSEFNQKIEEFSDVFLKEIESVCREGFDYDRESSFSHESGFPMLGVADDLYYKSTFQESYLEWRIRDRLVNEMLNYLFKSHGIDIRWRWKDSCTTTGGFTNKENENKFPVEFFLVINEKFIAYRYTPFTADYSIPLNLPPDLKLTYYQTGMETIDQWVYIDWSGLPLEKVQKKYYGKNETEEHKWFQKVTTVEALFDEYFSKEEYELFVSGICKAVEKANKLMGFQTIPRLITNNIGVFKEDVKKDLYARKYDLMRYMPVDKTGELNDECSDGVLSKSDYMEMNLNFKKKDRYLSLVGTSKFAKSYVTSEYLFRIFKDEIPFDYTSVVAGYIKSVEQLSESLIYDVIAQDHNENLFIISKRFNNKKEKQRLEKAGILKWIDNYLYVSMAEGNEKYFKERDKITMGQMFYFFEVNQDNLFCIDTKNSTPKIIECMNNYLEFDRNGYFHKHNINQFQVAKRIRNNTQLILYWLLGAVKLSDKQESINEKLGTIDDRFERLFKKIAYKRSFKYELSFGNDVWKKVVRVRKKQEYKYDEDGYIADAELRFLEVEEYPNNYIEYRDLLARLPESQELIVIDKSNVPEKMIVIDNQGRRETIDIK